MTDAPVYLSPFEAIVGVGWSVGKFAALQFGATWEGNSPNANNFQVFLPQLGISFPIWGPATTSPFVRTFARHRTETTTALGSHTVQVLSYTFTASFSHPPDAGSTTGAFRVTVDNGQSTYEFDGGDPPPGVGDANAAAAAFLNETGWDNFSSTLVSTTTETKPGGTLYDDTDADVMLFDLGAIKTAAEAINAGGLPDLFVIFTVGNPPGTVDGGTPRYDWTSHFATYHAKNFAAFPVTAVNAPDHWPAEVHADEISRTTGQAVQYQIDPDTLAVARI